VDVLIRTMIGQAPAVAALLYLVFRLDSRIAELQAVLVDLLKAEQVAAHERSVKNAR